MESCLSINDCLDWVGFSLQFKAFRMGVRLSVEDVVGVVGKMLASIDVRSASGFIDSKWQNVMTVVRLSPHSPADVSNHVLDTFRKHGSIRTPEFRIDQKVIGFQEWNALLAEFTKGQLEFPDVMVEFGGPVGIGGSMGYVQNKYYSLLPLPDWPVLEASLSTVAPTDGSTNPQYRVNSESIQRAVSKAGYSGVFDAINTLLGIKLSQGFSGFDVFIAVPIMARIMDAVVHPGECTVKVSGTWHQTLSLLQVFGSCYGRSGAARERISFTMHDSSSVDDLAKCAWESCVPKLDMYEFLEVRLVHAELGEVYSDTWPIRNLIPEQYVNPLYFLLTQFCSPERLRSLLGRPHSVAPQKTKPQKDFEQHVAWVLACYGFSAIVLGAHEDLFAEQTKVKRGTLDLIAYHPARKLMLLGGCTLNVPKEEDYAQLLSVRAILLEDWKGDLPFACVPVMFTGSPNCPGKSSSVVVDSFIVLPSGDDVKVIDANCLSQALTLIEERKENQFFSRFLGPDLSSEQS